MAKPRADHPAQRAGNRRSVQPSFFRRTETGLERIIFFSDAVIAIAITLLALDIRLPDETIPSSQLASALLGLLPHYVSFFTSFFVIGLFWMSHHRIFEYIHTYDRGLMWINLLFLFLIAFTPFPTTILGQFPAQRTSVMFYAALMVCLALVRILLSWYVFYRGHLARPDTDPRIKRFDITRPIWTAALFGISIGIAYWSPGMAMNFWLLIIPVTILTRSPF